MGKSLTISCSWLILGLLVILESHVNLQVEARAFFVFGDSLVDNGNNNYLATTARADAPPYGIDYPTHRPTGRFSNGLNIPDVMSEQLGMRPTLPYMSPELDGETLLVGANFASAGIGILNDTGIQFVNIIKITSQLRFFEQYQQRLSAIIGVESAKRLVNEALVLISLGGNDFVNNYFLLPFSPRSREFSLADYVAYLITEYKKILARLHKLGARRVLVTGTGPLGCVPAELAQHSINGECASELQRAAALYNPQLVQMINDLNRQMGATPVFYSANAFEMHMDFINDPQAYGIDASLFEDSSLLDILCFRSSLASSDLSFLFSFGSRAPRFVTSKVACCGQGPYNGLGLCTPLSNLCADRNQYAFWDAFHPSEKANRILAQQILTGTPQYMHPMNLSTIM
ncbi:Lipase_GDSL domain-containing protein, partial [Cephalotus follicularis]